jgi:predicted Zn-dependent peptidase
MFGVYAGCQPAKAAQVLEICRDQLDLVARGGITADELTRGKGQLAGSLVLGLEDTGSRMSRLGKAELVYGELLTVDEILSYIQAVTLDEVRAVAAEVLSAKQTLAVIGPFDENAFADAVA